MRLAMARPRPVPPFSLVVEESACWNSSKILLWSAAEMPGPVSCTATVTVPSAVEALIAKLDRIADEIEQHLRQPSLIAARLRQLGGDVHLEGEPFVVGQRLHRAEHVVHDVLHRIIAEREIELPGLDLR